MKLYTSEAPEIEDIGIADNDIDGFLRDLLESVIREPTQNSNDEPIKRPVRMSFDLDSVATNEIPDVDSYKYVIERCLEEAHVTNAKKAQEFFQNAVTVLDRENISILRISDSGTRGAGGEFNKGNKFYTLAVSKGRTNKDNLYSAGSFGIGKNAAFAGSELRLVFYSSVYEDEAKSNYYCMGKSTLTSWRREDGQNMHNKVFFVEDSGEFKPESSQEHLPRWLKKLERGLQVAIVAPRIELKEGWVDGYVASLLRNFFVAIHDGDIEFSLDGGRIIINSSTMLEYFSQPAVVEAAEKSGTAERLSWARHCSEALAAGEFISEKVSIPNLGDFEILIKVAENLPKKVCIVRNGMFITDTLSHFGKHLARFASTKDFIVIVRPNNIDDDSSEMIKRMENPEHNELTTGYIADETEVKKLTSAVKKLEEEVRGIISKHAKMEVLESKEIDELKDYFPSSGDSDDEDSENEDDPTAVTILQGAKKVKAKTFAPGGKKGGKGKQSGKKTKKKGKRGPGGSQSGNFKLIDLPVRAVKAAGGKWRIELAAPTVAGECEIWPQETSRGRETRSIKIISCSLGSATIAADGLSMKFPAAAGVPISMDIELDSNSSVVDLRPVVKA